MSSALKTCSSGIHEAIDRDDATTISSLWQPHWDQSEGYDVLVSLAAHAGLQDNPRVIREMARQLHTHGAWCSLMRQLAITRAIKGVLELGQDTWQHNLLHSPANLDTDPQEASPEMLFTPWEIGLIALASDVCTHPQDDQMLEVFAQTARPHAIERALSAAVSIGREDRLLTLLPWIKRPRPARHIDPLTSAIMASQASCVRLLLASYSPCHHKARPILAACEISHPTILPSVLSSSPPHALWRVAQRHCVIACQANAKGQDKNPSTTAIAHLFFWLPESQRDAITKWPCMAQHPEVQSHHTKRILETALHIKSCSAETKERRM